MTERQSSKSSRDDGPVGATFGSSLHDLLDESRRSFELAGYGASRRSAVESQALSIRLVSRALRKAEQTIDDCRRGGDIFQHNQSPTLSLFDVS